jgi:hypothetical protein
MIWIKVKLAKQVLVVILIIKFDRNPSSSLESETSEQKGTFNS